MTLRQTEGPPSADLQAFARPWVGPRACWRPVGRPGDDARVWRVRAVDASKHPTAAGAGSFHVKLYADGRHLEQERHAYLRWAPALEPATARLVAASAERPRALLLTTVPGEPAEACELEAATECALHREAGRLLSRLHALEPGSDDPVPLARAIPARAAAWARRARGLGLEREADALLARIQRPGLFGAARRLPCHRDFEPRNWLVSGLPGLPSGAPPLAEGLRLGVIDFGHARPDHPLVDLVKLVDGPWAGRPDLERAFFAGYGRELTDRERLDLEALLALHALATVAWAIRAGDAAFEARGRALLERLQTWPW